MFPQSAFRKLRTGYGPEGMLSRRLSPETKNNFPHPPGREKKMLLFNNTIRGFVLQWCLAMMIDWRKKERIR